MATFEDRVFLWKTKIGLMKAEKILSIHPQGLHARIYLCILSFVGTISCERKARVDSVRFTATKTATNLVQCLGQHRTSSGRLLTYPPVRYQREEADMGVAWYRGSLVWSDISGAPVQGGFQQ